MSADCIYAEGMRRRKAARKRGPAAPHTADTASCPGWLVCMQSCMPILACMYAQFVDAEFINVGMM